MKIGVGITTTGAREVRFDRYTGLATYKDLFVHVHTDEAREGPARAKNKTIKALYDAGCDAMFFFDDDCYPMHVGWDEYVFQQYLATKMPFFGLPESFKNRFPQQTVHNELVWWENIIGCFTFHTREVVERVGYYNTAYVGYGYEDAARNDRIKREFFPGPNYPSLLRLPSYIYSEDVYGQNPTPNLTMAQKLRYIEQNKSTFEQEMYGAQTYYPFG